MGRRVRAPGSNTRVVRLPVFIALCVRILPCMSVGIIYVVHKARNYHGATSFVCGYKGDVLRDHLSKMAQCLCTPASFGNSEGGHMDVGKLSYMKMRSA